MPDWKNAITSRLSTLRLRPARELEIIEELSEHLDEVYRERRTGGATHDEAVRAALEELDDADLLARGLRPLRQASPPVSPPPGAPARAWIPDLVQDVRYAARTLAATPGWTAVVLLLLAIGIGANAAVFTATDAALLSSVPAHDPDALIRLRWNGDNDAMTDQDDYGFTRRGPDGLRPHSTFSYQVFEDLAARARGSAELFAMAPMAQVNLVIDGRAELGEGIRVTGNYFTVLGVMPRAGRLIVPNDDRPGAPAVAVISERYWQARFGGDPAAIGRTIRANNVPVVIVGVTPAAFTGVQETLAEPPDVTFPLSLDRRLRVGDASALDQPTWWWLEVMGRLSPATSASRLEAMLAGPFQQTTHAAFEAYAQTLTDTDRARSKRHGAVPHLAVEPGRGGVYDVESDIVTSVKVLGAVAVVVLLIICANIANLLLSRAVARRKEIAVRLSLGATRGRLIRQVFAEGLLLAATGGALGLFLAWQGIRLLPDRLGDAAVFQWHTVGFTALATLLTTVLFAAAPAMRGTHVSLTGTLKDVSRTIARPAGLLARSLLVVQVTLSLALLVGAGLLLSTVNNLRKIDVGFDPNDLLLVNIQPTVSGYEQARLPQLYGSLIERLAAVPGVRGAAYSQPGLLFNSISSTSIYVQGQSSGPDAARTMYRLVVSPSFFDVYRVPIVRGRALTDRDTQGAPRVALVNETAARMYFETANPIGRRFGSDPDQSGAIEVVGVVRDTKYSNLRAATPPTMYVTYMQMPRGFGFLTVRTAGAPEALTPAVREAIRDVAPQLPLAMVTTQMEQVRERMSQETLLARAYSIFGALALLLAAVGLFGLMSYNVAQRTGEMGIRMALGAQRADVVRLVLRDSLTLVAIGIVAGLGLALAAGRLIAALLVNVRVTDPATMATAAAGMLAICAIAAYLPARRASRIDPMLALRCE